MFDGVFIHHLTNELQSIVGLRINKVNVINENEYFFILQNKKKLFFSINSNNPHIRLTQMDYVNSSKSYNLHLTLKKNLESGIITNIYQHNNDRIIIISVTSFDELGYKKEINLILEFFGRNANIILTNKDMQIIDTLKRLFPTVNDDRIILPKYIYKFPESNKINPFIENTLLPFNNYEGVSNLCFEEISYLNDLNIIFSQTKPTLIKANKLFFYCFDLKHIDNQETTYYDSLSSLLENYYLLKNVNNSFNNEQEYLQTYINKEIDKLKNKIVKQQYELNKATENLKYEQIGNLLASNLFKVKKGDTKITVDDFYNNNEPITINLDSQLTPNQNLELVFNKYNKSKRALTFINEQISKSNKDIEYLQCLQNQLLISKSSDIKEIYEELGLKTNKNQKSKSKPSYLVFTTLDHDTILVGKNNVQNNYITHKLANKDDYFFHVQNIPGSHTILKCSTLNENNMLIAATIAAYYSKYRNATNVCVDYTLIKNVRKVPGINGSFVTYKNQKSIFVHPELEFIKKNTIN